MVLLRSEQKLKKGNKIPPFNLLNVNDKNVRPEDFHGKAIVVIFMCNHCPFVKAKFQDIADLQKSFPDVIVVGINSNDPETYPEDDFSHMKGIAAQYGYKYYLFDDTQDVAKQYGAVCTPDPFVFDKVHKLIYHGRINNAMNPGDKPTKHDLREVLQKMKDGKEITEWFIPSQGCSIKWKN